MNINLENIDISKLLHQRPPYLMVDKVISLTETTISVEKNHRGDEAHLKGHFPGAPVVPGAMLQEICTQGAGILLTIHYSPIENYDSSKPTGYALGVLKRVSAAKFISMTKPDIPIQANITLLHQLDNLFQFKAEVLQQGKVKAYFEFSLVNIPEDYLH